MRGRTGGGEGEGERREGGREREGRVGGRGRGERGEGGRVGEREIRGGKKTILHQRLYRPINARLPPKNAIKFQSRKRDPPLNKREIDRTHSWDVNTDEAE